MLKYFGLQGSVPHNGDTKTTTTSDPNIQTAIRALPASWYNSPEMYQLERRAIFSRRWQLITHKVRFTSPGTWIKFSVAGYEFILVRDRRRTTTTSTTTIDADDFTIRGFHNVCRHRAFPIVSDASTTGTAQIFSCKYHGWSYGLDGQLAKAPRYSELASFDKAQNGLLPIHVRVDACGFIWINLDATQPAPEVPWVQDFDGIDTQERYKAFAFDDYVLDHEYTNEGNYNWKILADNFNECYHCPVAHPDIPTLADIETLDCDTDHGWIKHQSTPSEEQKELGLAIASTYFWPNVSISVLPHFIMLQRFLPHSASRSTMHYQIFRHKSSTDAQFNLIHNLYKKVISEDKALCELSQRNLNRGVFVNGEMHPKLEKGPLFFQNVTRKAVYEWVEREREAGVQVWPAQMKVTVKSGGGNGEVSVVDEEVCASLKVGTGGCAGAVEGLAW